MSGRAAVDGLIAGESGGTGDVRPARPTSSIRRTIRVERALRGGGLRRHVLANYVVPAELLSQGRGEARGIVLFVARLKAREQARGDHGSGDVLLDGGGDGPAAFAGVFDERLDRLERAVFLEHALGQLEQPRADDAAAVPDVCDLVQIERELRLAEDLEAFAVRFHRAVLDAVVDHLDEVAGAVRAHLGPAVGWSQGVEDRLAALQDGGESANHHAVSFAAAPDAAGGADVDEADTAIAETLGSAHRVFVVAVAAVDD